MSYFYIIDIGGTNIQFGVSHLSRREPLYTTYTPNTREEIINTIYNVINEFDAICLNDNIVVDNVMVSCPGLIDENGYVEKALYIDLACMDLQGILEKKLNRKVRVYNDAKVQTIGRFVHNKALLYMCIGTAVGGGFCSEKGLFLGGHGRSCEFGHVLIKNGDSTCYCGRKGCLDTVISGKAMIDRLGPDWWKFTTSQAVKDYLEQAALATCETIETLALLFDPDEICVCGKLCQLDVFRRNITELWKYNKWSKAQIDLAIDTWEFVYNGTNRLFYSENTYINF